MSFCFLPIGADYKNKRRNERGMRDPHCKPERAQRVTVEFTQPEISLKGKKKKRGSLVLAMMKEYIFQSLFIRLSPEDTITHRSH